MICYVRLMNTKGTSYAGPFKRYAQAVAWRLQHAERLAMLRTDAAIARKTDKGAKVYAPDKAAAKLLSENL
jgi:hypothetical protein